MSGTKPIHTIEAEQQKQFSLFQQLLEAIRSERPHEQLRELLDQLIDHTHVHFLSEHLTMLMYSFPDYREHEEAHTHFLREMNTVKERFSRGEFFDLVAELEALHDWLVDHVRGHDRQLSTFLAEQ